MIMNVKNIKESMTAPCCSLVDNEKILESWIEGVTGLFLSHSKIKKVASNSDVIIILTYDPQLKKENSFVFFHSSKKLKTVESFEGAMHLYF